MILLREHVDVWTDRLSPRSVPEILDAVARTKDAPDTVEQALMALADWLFQQQLEE